MRKFDILLITLLALLWLQEVKDIVNFTEAVKAAMQKLGLKTSDIAKSTGLSYQYIHDLLSGDRRWNEDTINKVCEALDIQVTFEQKESEHEAASVID